MIIVMICVNVFQRLAALQILSNDSSNLSKRTFSPQVWEQLYGNASVAILVSEILDLVSSKYFGMT